MRRSHPFGAARALLLAAAGVVLAWLVVSTSLVAYLANEAPQAALWLRPSDPVALLNLVERSFDPAKVADKSRPGGDPERPPDQLRVWAETALGNEPINARALRVLGQLALASGDESRAAVYMRAAARRWIHESAAVLWLMRDSFAKKDYDATLYFADALLRTQPQAMPLVLPVLGPMAENPQARAKLEQLLAGNPPWRRAFFSVLHGAVTDARTPLKLLLATRETATPATLADIRPYLQVLVQQKFYELAYYTWLQFLPPEQLAGVGFLFNGSFELASSGVPFDWTVDAGAGATVDFAPRLDRAGQRALLIHLGPGRVDLRGVWQTLLLAPGAYRLQGKYRGEIAGPRGLVWRIACAGGPGQPIGQSGMMLGAAAGWKDFELSFTVPATDCRAQHLHLFLDARMPSEQLVSGSIWYDDLRISREE